MKMTTRMKVKMMEASPARREKRRWLFQSERELTSGVSSLLSFAEEQRQPSRGGKGGKGGAADGEDEEDSDEDEGGPGALTLRCFRAV
jgi:hypothetical protein